MTEFVFSNSALEPNYSIKDPKNYKCKKGIESFWHLKITPEFADDQ